MTSEATMNPPVQLPRWVWAELDAPTRRRILARPGLTQSAQRAARVAEIIDDVRARGDSALRDWTQLLDGCAPPSLAVPQAAFDAAAATLPDELKQAIGEARQRIETFHRASMPAPVRVETAPGVLCERLPRPIASVGLYVPAGSAPLPSTALMLGVPAQLAGCREVVLCTPPRADGRADPAVLFAARQCGIERVFTLGGAQAIAAMAWGSDSVPACDKLFGPGNAWVTEAKQQVANIAVGPAIDMPAGPSEILIIADAAAEPRCVAADLLSQAEHGPDSQVLLASDSAALLDAVAGEVAAQCARLPRAEIARQALAHARLVEVASLAEAAEVSNRYAPEHLILNVAEPRQLLARIENAGSVFLGAWAPESMGDYCSGTNHVLPTGGHARVLSGLGVDSFCKQITVQELTPAGLRGIGPCAQVLARAEGLEAHARAVSVRLQQAEAAA